MPNSYFISERVTNGANFEQGKKFSNHRETLEGSIPENDLNLSDSDVGRHGRHDQLTASWLKRPGEGAGDGFVTSIRGLFNTQRRKAKAFVIRTMRGEGHNNDEYQDEWSESDGEYPFARQLTITKAKKLIRRKFRPRGQKNSGIIPSMLILCITSLARLQILLYRTGHFFPCLLRSVVARFTPI